MKDSRSDIDKKTKILAMFCKLCPFCVAARQWPYSAYAKKLREIEKHCPFCNAYSKLKAGILKTSNRSNNGFTLIELLVVIAIISLLLGILVPSLHKAKYLVEEKICASNLRQVTIVLMVYAENNNGWLPLEPTEHNSHPGLLEKLDARSDDSLMKAFYCSRDEWQDKIAQNPDEYIPDGATDSVKDTPENRELGNIGYVYWSFVENKYFGTKSWRNPAFFIPRKLRTSEVKWIYPNRPHHKATPSETWVISDFFRRGAPFPHTRKHAHGLNMSYLDGHVDLLKGKPKLSYR